MSTAWRARLLQWFVMNQRRMHVARACSCRQAGDTEKSLAEPNVGWILPHWPQVLARVRPGSSHKILPEQEVIPDDEHGPGCSG